MHTKQWFTVVLLGAVLSAAVPGAVLAAGHRTVYVDDTGTANAAKRGGCGHPNYATIQAAVDDLTASHIIVCSGMYAEQVKVSRNLTLEGRSGAVIQAPAVVNTPGAIVTFSGAQESRLRGFTITGATTTNANLTTGVAVRDGAHVTISHNTILDILDNDPVYQVGTGIDVQQGSADITDNTIKGYASGGILASSNDTFVMVDDNTIRGQGTSSAAIGINIREGAHGDVEDNTITDNKGEGGVGIVVDLTDQVSLRDNTVTNNGTGIILGDEVGASEVRSNVIRNNVHDGVMLVDNNFNTVVENESDHNGGNGIRLFTSQSDPNSFNNTIATNKVHDNAGDGIHLGPAVVNNTLKENRSFNNHGVDIVDLNGTPLKNTYQDNHCGTSNPSGLCSH